MSFRTSNPVKGRINGDRSQARLARRTNKGKRDLHVKLSRNASMQLKDKHKARVFFWPTPVLPTLERPAWVT